MPQLRLPIFPDGLTSITEDLGFQREDGQVVYFHGLLPVFRHDQKDLRSFRMFTSQLIANGTVRQRDIVQAFGVPLATVKRYMNLHRQQGTAGFFRQPPAALGQRADSGSEAAGADTVGEGKSVPEVSGEIGVAANTLHKAIHDGRLHGGRPKEKR